MFEQPSLFDTSPQVRSVTDITRYIRRMFDADFNLRDVWLEGEISNWRPASSGHIYFTLKDSGASIRCVIWRSQAEQLLYLPQTEGEAVLAHGKISVYEAGGNYQFYVDELEAAGLGALHAQFERIKKRLEAEGLFDSARKRPLPPFPQTIGLVTSPQAAALRDMLNVLRRRYPLARVILSPTPVQGDSAPPQIVRALQAIAQQPVEVIILARGGGSLEDLWAFNNESVARAIAACPVPVVSGVGHETDFTIADFVADVRAPTPSAAAELVSPDRDELQRLLAGQQLALTEQTRQRVSSSRAEVRRQQWLLARLSPQGQVNNSRQNVDSLVARAGRSLRHQLILQRQQVSGLSERLAALNPQATLSRGYAIVQKGERVVASAGQVGPGDELVIKLVDGEIDAEVRQVK